MQLVRLGLSPRAAGQTRAQAQAHWRGVHAQLFARVPGVRSYVQHHALLGEDGTPLLGDPGFDIFSEVGFDSDEGMVRAMASNWYRGEVIPDEERLLDASRRCFLVTQRHAGATRVPQAGGACTLSVFLAGEPAGLGTGARAWWQDKRLAALFAGAEGGVATYVVQAAGGAAPRPVDAVLARTCASAAEALVVHAMLANALASQGSLRIEAAVVSRENEVVARQVEGARS